MIKEILSLFEPHEQLIQISSDQYRRLFNFMKSSSKAETPTFIFKNRENTLEVLGIDIHQSSAKRPNSKKDIWFSCETFFDDQPLKNTEWQRVDHKNYIRPKFGLLKHNSSFYFYQNDFSKNQASYLESLFTKDFTNNDIILKANSDSPNLDEWQAMMSNALEVLNSSESALKKIVLSRKKEFKLEAQEQSQRLINEIYDKASESFFFLFRIDQDFQFISMTPERLFKLENNELLIDAIAGTTKRSKDLDEDQRLEQRLLTDKKELSEHRIVKDQIESLMSPYGKLKIQFNEQILKLKFIQHIHSLYKLELKQSRDNDYQTFIDLLHPTPAVGGSPTELAADLIKNIEPYSRGLYAAPAGVTGPFGSDFCVAIRSALITKNKLSIFGGAGIMPTSTAENEWIETENKMLNFLNIINPSKKTLIKEENAHAHREY